MYEIWTYIKEQVGNNAFSYNERIALWSTGKIFVPSLIQGTVADLEIGSEICFEEVQNGKIISCAWLKNFVQLEYHWTPVFIVDNHNHALAFRYTYNIQHPTCSLVHIDQHADTKPNQNRFPIPDSWFPIPEVEDFINKKTNVGNFITAAVNSWIIEKVIQVRTDYTLRELQASSFKLQAIILDIDADFRVDKEITQEEIQIIRGLIKKAKLVTIATSPYFMDQQKAIEIIKKILS